MALPKLEPGWAARLQEQKIEGLDDVLQALSVAVLGASRMASELIGHEVKGVIISEDGVRWVFDGGCECHTEDFQKFSGKN